MLAVTAVLFGSTVLAGCAACPNCVGDGVRAPVAGYCYRTLADVDCYTTPEINREPLALLRQPVN